MEFRERFKMKGRGVLGGGSHASECRRCLGAASDAQHRHGMPAAASLRAAAFAVERGHDLGERAPLTAKSADALDGGELLVQRGTIRFMLHNEAYVGRWSFRKREWRKVPGTKKKRSRLRKPADVMRIDHPELRIIDEETWTAVQRRLAAVHARYTKTVDCQPKGRGIAGSSSSYLLSGLMLCGECSAPMVICGVRRPSYWCGDYRKRGVCCNETSLREDIARPRILDALHDRFASREAHDYLRQRIAEHLGNAGRIADAEIDERRQRLARTEALIAGMIQFIAKGDQSEYMRASLLDHEPQARTEKAAIEALMAAVTAPVHLPTPDELAKRDLELDKVLAGDPKRGAKLCGATSRTATSRSRPSPAAPTWPKALSCP